MSAALISTSIRMSPRLLTDLKALAAEESQRRGRYISWSRLLRRSGRRLAKAMKDREAVR